MESWNKLCRALSEEISSDLLETLFEREVIYALDSVLGWDRYENIVRQVPIQMGSTIKHLDILVKEKRGKDLFIIEVKRPSISLKGHEEQLKSYILQKRMKLGVLIGKRIKIYFDKGSDITLIDEVEFKRDSQKGLDFVNTFHKSNYSEENIQKYIKDKLKEKEEIKIIKKLRKEILSENYNQKIISFLKCELQDNYSENVIEKVFDDLVIKMDDTSNKFELVNLQKKENDYQNINSGFKDIISVNTYIKDSFSSLDKNLISEIELSKLQDLTYSRNTFKISYPFLRKVSSLKNDDINRYWKINFYIKNEVFVACSEWSNNAFQKKTNKTIGEVRKYKFDIWLNNIKNQE